jgi:RsiW-degrading membrane proteinase PrsW (M82 family)
MLTIIGYAVLGGLLPSLVWLYFLLKEDAAHPEPKWMIALAFVVGMLAVPLVLPAEQWACAQLALDPTAACTLNHITWQTFGWHAIVSWALIEEVAKYAVAAAFILWRPAVDEPIDYVIYLITVALGFAAAENMLYLVGPFASGKALAGLFTDNLRFLGANLLHVVASSAIGLALAFSAQRQAAVRAAAAGGGLILAVALHSAFNALIISGSAEAMLAALAYIWTAVVVLLAAIELLKYFSYQSSA